MNTSKKDKLNILLVTNEFYNKDKNGIIDGGIANEYYKFAKKFMEQGHKVYILCKSDRHKRTIYDGIIVYEIKPKKYFKIIRNILLKICKLFKRDFTNNKYYLFLQGFSWFIKIHDITDKYDIIQYTSEYALGLFNPKNKPYLTRIASYTKNFFEEYDKTPDYDLFDAQERVFKKSKFICGPSKYIANLIKTDLNINKEVKIIETPFMESTKERDLTYYNSIPSKKYALFFGTLGLLKGVFDIADIVYDILDKYQDLNFVFVGKQIPLKKTIYPVDVIKNKAGKYANRIIYFDKMPHKFLYPIIENSHFCIMPSRTENFSNTCLEAMYFKKVVIGSTPFFDQILENGVTGFLCEPKNPNSIKEAIIKVMNLTDKEKEIIGNNAYQRIQQCNPDKMANEMLDYYRYIIKNS